MEDQNLVKRYFVTVGTNSIGPLSWNDINENVLKSRIALSCAVYDKTLKMWTTVLNILTRTEGVAGLREDLDPLEMQALRANKNMIVGLLPKEFKEQTVATTSSPKPQAQPPTPQGTNPVTSAAIGKEHTQTMTKTSKGDNSPADQKFWYIKQGKVALGPYSFLMMMVLFRDKSLAAGDLVRLKGDTKWEDAFNVFPQAERDYFTSMLPKRMERDPEKTPEMRKQVRKAIDAVVIVTTAEKQVVAQGHDLSRTHISFLTLAPELQQNERVAIRVDLPFGKVVEVKGVIEKVHEISANTVTARLIKYVMRLDSDMDPAIIDG